VMSATLITSSEMEAIHDRVGWVGWRMMLFSLLLGKVEIGPDQVEGLIKAIQLSFSIFAFLCLLGIFASLARREKQTR